MTTAVKAVYEDGVLKPEEPLEPEEKTEVEVLIHEPAGQGSRTTPRAGRRSTGSIGSMKARTTDVSEKHDDYLYDDPHD